MSEHSGTLAGYTCRHTFTQQCLANLRTCSNNDVLPALLAKEATGIVGYDQSTNVSDAGKTTLMDVLAGRKTQGVTKGSIAVNGHPKVPETWARVVGYVEQTDVHSEGLTVEESLAFSAGLRLMDDVPHAMREAYILEVLLVTELLNIRDNLVGVPGESGLSVEQRRRLSIGANTLIFMNF
jgi:ABC-type multidrug transport system ATPase subunit